MKDGKQEVVEGDDDAEPLAPPPKKKRGPRVKHFRPANCPHKRLKPSDFPEWDDDPPRCNACRQNTLNAKRRDKKAAERAEKERIKQEAQLAKQRTKRKRSGGSSSATNVRSGSSNNAAAVDREIELNVQAHLASLPPNINAAAVAAAPMESVADRKRLLDQEKRRRYKLKHMKRGKGGGDDDSAAEDSANEFERDQREDMEREAFEAEWSRRRHDVPYVMCDEDTDTSFCPTLRVVRWSPSKDDANRASITIAIEYPDAVVRHMEEQCNRMMTSGYVADQDGDSGEFATRPRVITTISGVALEISNTALGFVTGAEVKWGPMCTAVPCNPGVYRRRREGTMHDPKNASVRPATTTPPPPAATTTTTTRPIDWTAVENACLPTTMKPREYDFKMGVYGGGEASRRRQEAEERRAVTWLRVAPPATPLSSWRSTINRRFTTPPLIASQLPTEITLHDVEIATVDGVGNVDAYVRCAVEVCVTTNGVAWRRIRCVEDEMLVVLGKKNEYAHEHVREQRHKREHDNVQRQYVPADLSAELTRDYGWRNDRANGDVVTSSLHEHCVDKIHHDVITGNINRHQSHQWKYLFSAPIRFNRATLQALLCGAIRTAQ